MPNKPLTEVKAEHTNHSGELEKHLKRDSSTSLRDEPGDHTIRSDSEVERPDAATASHGIEEARNGHKLFRFVFETAPDAMVIVNERGRIQLINSEAERLFGFKRQELLGRSVESLVPRQLRKRHRALRRSYVSSPRVRPMSRHMRMQGRRKDGALLPLEIKLSPIDTEAGLLVNASIRDISERLHDKELLEREKLRMLVQGLLEGQDKERRRLAGEIHDDFSQRLAKCIIKVGLLRKRLARGSRKEIFQLIAEIEAESATLANDVQNFARNLHPSTLEHVGLVQTLKSHCEEFSRLRGVKVRLYIRKFPEWVSPDVALCLFRTAQECLRNIAKHSEAREARISLTGYKDSLGLSIRDNGRGFDVSGQRRRTVGIGLICVEERILRHGGTFMLRSTPGKGTTIQARMPLQAEPARGTISGVMPAPTEGQ